MLVDNKFGKVAHTQLIGKVVSSKQISKNLPKIQKSEHNECTRII